MLKIRITEDMKTALRAQDKARLSTIRLILAAVKQKEIDERILLTDPQVIGVLESMMKQRKESIAQYSQAARQDLVDKETLELSVIQNYLPEPLSETALDKIIQDVIAETKATTVREMGKVMAALKPKIQGRADMGTASARVKALLQGI